MHILAYLAFFVHIAYAHVFLHILPILEKFCAYFQIFVEDAYFMCIFHDLLCIFCGPYFLQESFQNKRKKYCSLKIILKVGKSLNKSKMFWRKCLATSETLFEKNLRMFIAKILAFPLLWY